MGLNSLAAGGAGAFAVAFVFSMWLTHDGAPADAALRPEPRALAVASSLIAKSPIRNARARLASLKRARTSPSGGKTLPQNRLVQVRPSVSALRSTDPMLPRRPRYLSTTVSAAKARGPKARSGPPRPSRAQRPPHCAARAARLHVRRSRGPRRSEAPKAGFQLASASETSLSLGYASANSATGAGVTGSLKGVVPSDSDPLANVDTSHTAIYDITSHTVYLPNGRRLEAHSGLGGHMDDPRSVRKEDGRRDASERL